MNSELSCQDMVRATMLNENGTQLSQATSAITTDTIYRESGLSIEEKKRKLEEIYSNGKFQEEDEYKVNKVHKVVRQHIFKHVKFC